MGGVPVHRHISCVPKNSPNNYEYISFTYNIISLVTLTSALPYIVII
jgi:hypothetical protein